MMRIFAKNTMLALLTVAGLAILTPGASAMTVQTNHDDIKIGLTYHGSTVSVSGMTDPNVDLIIKITTENGTEKLMRKDRAAGMWMNVEEITLDQVPEVYYLRSTRDPATILSTDEQNRYVIGYRALREKIDLKPAKPSEQRAKLLDDFIKYKEDGKVYGESLGDIDIKPDVNGESYYTAFDWPNKTPAGEYQVDVYAVKDEAVVDHAESRVTVEPDGAVKSLSNMAQNNGAVYGLAAIGVSVTAGFGVGIVFKSGGGSH